MKKSITYINNKISVYENKNEFIVSFSCAKDITNLLNATVYKKDLDSDYFNRFGESPEPSSFNDTVSFKMPDGSIDWELLQDFKNDVSGYQKAMSSIYRAKSTIYDLMQSNYWDYFVTITVNPKSEFWYGVDIKNVHEVQYKVTQRIRNLNKRGKEKIRYVLIPEYQENGNVHFHGVVSGVAPSDLVAAINNQEFQKDENGNIKIDDQGNKIPNKFFKQPLVRKGNQVYNYQKFADIGYNDFETIRDMSRVGSYCTKYITKDLFERANEYGSHLYICSQGLERKKEVFSREIDRFRFLTDQEIKENINENAYVVRTKFNTKITINKKYMKDVNALIKFVQNIEGGNVPSGVDDLSSSEKLLDVLPKLSEDERENIGVKFYDHNTGEIEFTKIKRSVPVLTYNPDSDRYSVRHIDGVPFRRQPSEDPVSVTCDQVRLW